MMETASLGYLQTGSRTVFLSSFFVASIRQRVGNRDVGLRGLLHTSWQGWGRGVAGGILKSH